MIKFLDLQKQYLSIKDDIDAAVQAVIADSAFVGGKYLLAFESDFTTYNGTQHCVGVGNGTDALEIAIEALELPPESEILVPANSFIASSEAVTRSGHRVVFCDCDPHNYTISINDMTKRVTTNTAAVIAVHLYGHPCDMDAVLSVAKQHDLKVIEDCAQAHGAEYKGKRVGSLGHAGAFSFYPGKNLGAYGDGGAIVTNNSAMAKRCRMLANHGRSKKYDHEFEGRNSRLDGLQAAILSIKLKHLDVWTERRIAVADLYLNALKDIEGLILPVREAWAKQVYHLFVIRTAKRDALKAYLQENGVQTGVHYPISLPKLNAYTYCNQMHEPMVANEYDEMLLSLPIGEHLSDDDVHQVVDLVKRFFV